MSFTVIDDIRFPNEVAICDLVVRVNRNIDPLSVDVRDPNHPSEVALDNYDFEHVINNNKNLDELEKLSLVIVNMSPFKKINLMFLSIDNNLLSI